MLADPHAAKDEGSSNGDANGGNGEHESKAAYSSKGLFYVHDTSPCLSVSPQTLFFALATYERCEGHDANRNYANQ